MERDAQSCNQCWRPVSGTICKTSCNHLFCEDCATSHFTQFDNCPVCNEHLDGEKDGTFQELLVGIAPGSLIDSLYQNAYRDPDFQNIGHQLLWALNGCREVLSTHLAQVQLEIMRHKSQHNQAEARRLQESKMGSEMKQRCIHLEHKVQDLERRNARLDRQLGEMRAELEKSQRQLEAYKAHYSKKPGVSPVGTGFPASSAAATPPSLHYQPHSASISSRSSNSSSAGNEMMRVSSFRMQNSSSSTPRMRIPSNDGRMMASPSTTGGPPPMHRPPPPPPQTLGTFGRSTMSSGFFRQSAGL